ncbi:hypothetical protein UFOVP1382_219 [uncultured Caudovirales phage]|uniref:Uncharacterized protein n=1 Tax=uncultured Caudovirales phage TaxID=2100421 RepID=A0A6J5S5E9_9CAUD|nr:hypothetical protein UFOVP1382_219 [uncultured Caudovirales phage]
MPVQIVKYAPCGLCKQTFRRDGLTSMNVHFYDENDVLEKIRVRACPTCIEAERTRFLAATWSDASMTTVELRAPEITTAHA